jgi:hypothetical protein
MDETARAVAERTRGDRAEHMPVLILGYMLSGKLTLSKGAPVRCPLLHMATVGDLLRYVFASHTWDPSTTRIMKP